MAEKSTITSGKMSVDLQDMLTNMLMIDIGGKAVDGITYVILTKLPIDEQKVKEYKAIRKEATRCGYTDDEIFRVYELSNGYLFDIDLNIVKIITAQLSKLVAQSNGNQSPVGDLIGDAPDRRRKADLISLGKYLKEEFSKGNVDINVALFSRNSVPRIIINGTLPNGKPGTIKYNAYAIRHWDIYTLNQSILIPMGFRVDSITPCGIIHSKSGILFNLKLKAMQS